MEKIDFSKGKILEHEGVAYFYELPLVEFTEDEWNTVYTGVCVESTHYDYLVDSKEYGRFWIPKAHVRLASSEHTK